MIKYILLCLLATSQEINARPAHLSPTDLASHILIVTPQAEVHLEPVLKYEAVVANTLVQHLSPMARLVAPHDETIIFLPSGAALNAVARASLPTIEQLRRQENRQYEQISQQIEQIQGAIQQGSSSVGPQLSEAASAAASAASNAGTGLFPALFPPSASGASQKEDRLKANKIEYETVSTNAANSLLSGAGESRRYYALTPAVSHLIDVYVSPLSAIRARSIEATDIKKTKITTDSVSSEGILNSESINEFKDKKEGEVENETLTKKADRLIEDRNNPEQCEQTLDSKEDKLGQKKFENIKFEEKLLEDKPFGENQLMQKKLPTEKFEDEKTLKERNFDEKKAQETVFVEYKQENNKFTEKKIDDMLFETKPLLQQSEEEKKQPIRQEAQQIPLLDRLQPSIIELEKPLKLLKEVQKQRIQERKEPSLLDRKEQPVEPCREAATEIQQDKHAEKEQPLEKQLFETSQQQQILVKSQQDEQKELQPVAQQQQKQFQSPEMEIKEIKESKQNSFELEQEQLTKERFQDNSVKLPEDDINQISNKQEKDHRNTVLQLQPQRLGNGRVEGVDTVAEQHSYHHAEELQQKAVDGNPVDQLPSIPLVVPLTKAV